MYLLYHHIKKKHIYVIILSSIIWLTLVLIENLIHYNATVNTDFIKDLQNFKIVMPDKFKWIKIIIIFTIFESLRSLFAHLIR
jgi:hypothetical protein